MKLSPRFLLSLQTALLLGALAGCSSPEKTAAKNDDDEYVTVTVTGSNIPKRIKKSDIAKGNIPKDVQMELMDKDQFAKSTQPANSSSRNN